MCRSRIPVRSTIHSLLVATICLKICIRQQLGGNVGAYCRDLRSARYRRTQRQTQPLTSPDKAILRNRRLTAATRFHNRSSAFATEFIVQHWEPTVTRRPQATRPHSSHRPGNGHQVLRPCVVVTLSEEIAEGESTGRPTAPILARYRCFLPDLAGLAGLRRVGPGTG